MISGDLAPELNDLSKETYGTSVAPLMARAQSLGARVRNELSTFTPPPCVSCYHSDTVEPKSRRKVTSKWSAVAENLKVLNNWCFWVPSLVPLIVQALALCCNYGPQ